jgi:hypothetical protein
MGSGHVLPDRELRPRLPRGRQIDRRGGLPIGDHTITYPYLTQLSDAAVRQEILGGARRTRSHASTGSSWGHRNSARTVPGRPL